jgi:CO dehydrogenase maturation factor
MGGVRKGGAGCACPESVLLKSLLSEIILKRREAVIVDMEAGIEHLGRATAGSIDKMLIIVEPGHRSIATAKKIISMGEEIGVQNFSIVGNKLQKESQKEWLKKQLPEELIVGMICYHDAIQDADQLQNPLIDLMDENVKREFQAVFSSLISSPTIAP